MDLFFYVHIVLTVNGSWVWVICISYSRYSHPSISLPTVSLCITFNNNHISLFEVTHLMHLLTSRFFEQNNIRWPFPSPPYIKVSAVWWACFSATWVLSPRLTLLHGVKAQDVTQASVLPTYCNISLTPAAVLMHEAGELLVSSISSNSIQMWAAEDTSALMWKKKQFWVTAVCPAIVSLASLPANQMMCRSV